MAADEFLAEEGARVADWLGGLLTRGLALPEGLTVDQRSRELEAARAAVAELAGAHWGHDSAGIEARVQAAQFVAAHAAAMEWQAEANRRDVPPHARATAQRLARQLMALTTSQLHALCRLKAERRKDQEQTARLAREQTAAQAKAWTADRRALVADLEQSLKAGLGPSTAADLDRELDPEFDVDLDELANLPLAMADPPPSTELARAAPGSAGGLAEAGGARGPARPEPVGADVPAPPPEPAPPLDRQQRRAIRRIRRKQRLRADRGVSGAA